MQNAIAVPRLALTALLFGIALALIPSVARADEPTRAAIDYRPEVRPESGVRVTTALAGAGLLAGGYGITLGTSFLWSDAPQASDLRLPVVGPVLAIANAGCGSQEAGCTTFISVARAVFAGIGGIVQVGGIGVLLESVFMTTQSSAGQTSASNATARLMGSDNTFVRRALDQRAANARLAPSGLTFGYAVPTVLPQGVGLVLGGRF